jgi:hypothetical protein
MLSFWYSLYLRHCLLWYVLNSRASAMISQTPVIKNAKETTTKVMTRLVKVTSMGFLGVRSPKPTMETVWKHQYIEYANQTCQSSYYWTMSMKLVAAE